MESFQWMELLNDEHSVNGTATLEETEAAMAPFFNQFTVIPDDEPIEKEPAPTVVSLTLPPLGALDTKKEVARALVHCVLCFKGTFQPYHCFKCNSYFCQKCHLQNKSCLKCNNMMPMDIITARFSDLRKSTIFLVRTSERSLVWYELEKLQRIDPYGLYRFIMQGSFSRHKTLSLELNRCLCEHCLKV